MEEIYEISIVGTSGIIVNEALLWALTEEIGMYYLFSNAISTEVATLNNFLWNDIWTFQDSIRRKDQSIILRVIKFHATRFGSIVLGVTLLAFFTEIFDIHYLLSNLLVMLLNYVTSKVLIWD